MKEDIIRILTDKADLDIEGKALALEDFVRNTTSQKMQQLLEDKNKAEEALKAVDPADMTAREVAETLNRHNKGIVDKLDLYMNRILHNKNRSEEGEWR